MINFIEFDQRPMFDFKLNAFIIKEFPEYINRVYVHKNPAQVSSQKMKQIFDLFNEEYEVVYWPSKYTYVELFSEDNEVEYVDCPVDAELVINTIMSKTGKNKEESTLLFKKAKSYFVNLYYGDSITYNFVAFKK